MRNPFRWRKPVPVARGAKIQPMPAAPVPATAPKQPVALRRGTLAALIGIPAAAMLLQVIPEDESGRKVDVTIAPDGTPTVKHISGKQYLKVYLDMVGVPTACDGLTDKQKIKLGMSFTEAQCAAMLEEGLVVHAAGLLRCTPGYVPQDRPYTTVGLVSATYNIGIAGYCGSSMKRNLVAGNIRASCDSLLKWNKGRVRGVLQPIPGLTKRRNREREYCITNVVPDATPANLNQRLARWK